MTLDAMKEDIAAQRNHLGLDPVTGETRILSRLQEEMRDLPEVEDKVGATVAIAWSLAAFYDSPKAMQAVYHMGVVHGLLM
ncbi:MAG: hypothetical protein JRD89_01555 [Deltaproteobacteria bacterium]|nr:hypothetical protein [Deltaproteobacteria bacterium]